MPIRCCGIRAALLFGVAGTTLALHGLVPIVHAAEMQGAQATVRSLSIGESREGRSIDLITVSTDPENADSRPALLIVAGVDATHQTGIAVARNLADRIAADHPELLTDRTVYIVPLLNPDASVRRSQGPIGSFDLRFAPKAIDVDRDRRIDEDGPTDINRDGYITQMRIRNPAPGSGLIATHVEHEDDPRLLRPADAGKGEIPVFAVMVEGMDQDGDGQVGEDPVGGIDLSRHFPYLWDEFDPVTGDYPLEDPGARALADWMLERANLVAVLTYGPHDTLSNLPSDGKYDVTRRVPLGIESDDKAAYELVQKAFHESTGLKNAEGRSNEGSLHGWAYGHLGLYSFSTPLWSVPDSDTKDTADAQPEAPQATEPEAQTEQDSGPSAAEIQVMINTFQNGTDEQRAELMQRFNSFSSDQQARIMAIASGEPDPNAPAAPQAQSRSRSGKKGASTGDAAWLRYADERGEGFIDWAAFDHPQFGEVEIGGFVPGFKLNAPSDQIDTLTEQQSEFVGELLGMFSAIEVSEPAVRDLGHGVYEITLRLSNTGAMPTRAAIAEKTRRWPPILVRPQIDRKAVLIGRPIESVERLKPGAHEDFVWTVRTSENTLDITISVPESGEQTVTVDLREGN